MVNNLGDRRQYLGASEVASALGYGVYDTAEAVWEYKTGRRANKARTPQMDRGHAQEAVLAKLYTDTFGRRVTSQQQEYRGEGRDWLRAHVDGLTEYGDKVGAVLDPSTIGLIEMKAPGWQMVRSYIENGVPTDHIFQVHTQMYLADMPFVSVAVYDYENHQPLCFDVMRDDEFISRILVGVDQFWSYVQAGVRPPQAVNPIEIPSVNGDLVSLVGAQAEELADLLVAARSSVKLAEADDARVCEAIKNLMTQKGLGLVQLGQNVRVSWKPQSPTIRTSAEKLMAWTQELVDAVRQGNSELVGQMARVFSPDTFQTATASRTFRPTFYGEAKDEVNNAGK